MGAKFWLKVLTDLKNRGVKDILMACVDGLTGFPQAIYPDTQVQWAYATVGGSPLPPFLRGA